MKPGNLEPTIRDMIAEIELDLTSRKVDPDDHAYGAYYAARLEMELGDPPNIRYVHNMLATALNRPLATRH